MLLQTIPRRASYIQEQVDPVHSGLVLSGPEAPDKTRRLREDGFDGPLLADPAVYERAAACEEEPFPSSGQLSFGDPLEDVGRRPSRTGRGPPPGRPGLRLAPAGPDVTPRVLTSDGGRPWPGARSRAE
jgi:hypothetical protein